MSQALELLVHSFDHLRMEPTVIPETQSDAGFSRGVDGLFGIVFRERERLFAENMFPGVCGSDDLRSMHRMRRTQHNRLNI